MILFLYKFVGSTKHLTWKIIHQEPWRTREGRG